MSWLTDADRKGLFRAVDCPCAETLGAHACTRELLVEAVVEDLLDRHIETALRAARLANEDALRAALRAERHAHEVTEARTARGAARAKWADDYQVGGL